MSIRTLTRLMVVALAAVVIPACGSSDKNRPPLVVNWTPAAPGNTAVARMPNIIVKFDRALDAATVTNTANWAVVKSGAPSGIPLSQVEYLPAVFEARIVPTSLLEGSVDYGIFVGGGIASADGIPVGGTFLLEVFTTNNTAGANTISWGGVTTAVGGVNPGEITLTWATATEGANPVSEYDVFLSTVTGGQDLLVRSGAGFRTFSNPTTGTITGLTPGTPYFIKVQPRSGATGCVFTSLAEVTATATP